MPAPGSAISPCGEELARESLLKPWQEHFQYLEFCWWISKTRHSFYTLGKYNLDLQTVPTFSRDKCRQTSSLISALSDWQLQYPYLPHSLVGPGEDAARTQSETFTQLRSQVFNVRLASLFGTSLSGMIFFWQLVHCGGQGRWLAATAEQCVDASLLLTDKVNQMYLDHVWSGRCMAEQVLRCQPSSAKKAGVVVTHPAQCKETRAAEGGRETLSLHCTIIHRHPMAFSVFPSHHKSTSVLLTLYSYCLLSKMVKCTETVTGKIETSKAKSA